MSIYWWLELVRSAHRRIPLGSTSTEHLSIPNNALHNATAHSRPDCLTECMQSLARWKLRDWSETERITATAIQRHFLGPGWHLRYVK